MSRPSSLLDRSDFPPPLAHVLPLVYGLTRAYRRRSSTETVGSQVRFPAVSLRMPPPLPRVPVRGLPPFSSRTTLAFHSNVKGRRLSCLCGRFVPLPDSPSDIRLALNHGAAAFALCCGLRIWPDGPLLGYDPRLFSASLRGVVSRQSSACVLPPKRASSLHTQKGNWCVHLLTDE